MDTKLLFLFPVGVVLTLFHPRDECPVDITEWSENKHRLNCSDAEYIYHCLLDDKGNLGEICIKGPAVWVQKGYCPQYNSFARTINTISCRAPKGCPPKSFASYEVYMYPACLQRGDVEMTPKDHPAAGSVPLPLIIVPVLVVTLLLASGIICILCRRKCRANSNSRETETGELEPIVNRTETSIPIEFNKIIRYLNAGVFFQTKKYNEAVNVLGKNGWITLSGPPGSGKTMTAIQLARRKFGQISSSGKKCVFHFCRNLREIPGFKNDDEEPFIILDDLLEQYMIYPSKLSQDKDMLESIFEELITPGLIHVLITVREDTWKKLTEDSILSEMELFGQAIVKLEKTLDETEKRKMLKKHLRKNIDEILIANEENVDLDKIVAGITGDSIFSIPIAINLICANTFLQDNHCYSLSNKLKYIIQDHLREWMKSDNYEDKKSMCLVLFAALCGGRLSMEDFDSHTNGHIYVNVCQKYDVERNGHEPHEIERMLKENLRVRGFLYPLSEDSNTYEFHHDSLLDFFLAHVCDDEKLEKLFIENANIEYILKKCKLHIDERKKMLVRAKEWFYLSPLSRVEIKQIGMLVDRIITEVKQGYVIPDWNDHVFMKHELFKSEWQKKS